LSDGEGVGWGGGFDVDGEHGGGVCIFWIKYCFFFSFSVIFEVYQEIRTGKFPKLVSKIKTKKRKKILDKDEPYVCKGLKSLT